MKIFTFWFDFKQYSITFYLNSIYRTQIFNYIHLHIPLTAQKSNFLRRYTNFYYLIDKAQMRSCIPFQADAFYSPPGIFCRLQSPYLIYLLSYWHELDPLLTFICYWLLSNIFQVDNFTKIIKNFVFLGGYFFLRGIKIKKFWYPPDFFLVQ